MSPSKQAVNISFGSRGAVPPVFVAGTFTEPQWEPHELDFKTYRPEDADGGSPECHFSKSFEVAPGEYQYKFRLGYGDWWVCDENGEIATDNAGNRNNRLQVDGTELPTANNPHDDRHVQVKPLWDKAAVEGSSAREASRTDSSSTRQTPNVKDKGSPELPTTDVQDDHQVPDEAPRNNSLASCNPSKGVPRELTDRALLLESRGREWEAPGSDPPKSQSFAGDAKEVMPFSGNGRNSDLAHENVAVDTGKVSDDDATRIRQSLPQQRQAEIADHLMEGLGDESNQSHNFQEINKHSHAPLFSHECLQCPEIAAPHCHRVSSPSRESDYTMDNSKDAAPCEPGEAEILDDPTIEMFPTEPMEILKRMATLHSELPEDDSVEEDASSPLYSPTFAGHPSPLFSHEMPIQGPPTPRHSFDADADGASDPRPILRSKSSKSEAMPTLYRANDSRHSFEDMKELDEEEREPLLKPEDPSKPGTTPHSLSTPTSEEIRKRRIGADSLPATTSAPDSLDSMDNGSGLFGAFFNAIFHWFGSCLLALFGGKGRE